MTVPEARGLADSLAEPDKASWHKWLDENEKHFGPTKLFRSEDTYTPRAHYMMAGITKSPENVMLRQLAAQHFEHTSPARALFFKHGVPLQNDTANRLAKKAEKSIPLPTGETIHFHKNGAMQYSNRLGTHRVHSIFIPTEDQRAVIHQALLSHARSSYSAKARPVVKQPLDSRADTPVAQTANIRQPVGKLARPGQYAYAFVSPSQPGATLDEPEALITHAKGLPGVQAAHTALGVWKGGAEPSAVIHGDPAQIAGIAEALGERFNQQAVMHFIPGEGDDRLHRLVVNQSPEAVHAGLGLDMTAIPGPKTTVLIADRDGENAGKIAAYAAQHSAEHTAEPGRVTLTTLKPSGGQAP